MVVNFTSMTLGERGVLAESRLQICHSKLNRQLRSDLTVSRTDAHCRLSAWRLRNSRRPAKTQPALDRTEHSSESVHMPTTLPLQPTLWRTCRVLANRTRLEMFRLLVQEPGQKVCAVARRLGRPRSLTSEYLRALEARGLLTARRVGRCVEYRLSCATNGSASACLVTALRALFQRETTAVEVVFRLATAFTHPRRVEIFRVLQNGPHSLGQLRAKTRISAWALVRHLRKLEARDFITQQGGLYAAVDCTHGIQKELARLAREK